MPIDCVRHYDEMPTICHHTKRNLFHFPSLRLVSISSRSRFRFPLFPLQLAPIEHSSQKSTLSPGHLSCIVAALANPTNTVAVTLFRTVHFPAPIPIVSPPEFLPLTKPPSPAKPAGPGPWGEPRPNTIFPSHTQYHNSRDLLLLGLSLRSRYGSCRCCLPLFDQPHQPSG